jgi:hypothetical protein
LTETEPIEEELTEEETPATEPSETKETMAFDISTPEGRKTFFEIMCISRGIDPNQVQGMAKFMDPDNVDETSYYPTQKTSLAIAQLRLYGEGYYKGEDWNEYDFAADIIGTGFKGFKGFKSEQWKDITSGQPNLEKIKGLPEETQKGILSGIFNRGQKE